MSVNHWLISHSGREPHCNVNKNKNVTVSPPLLGCIYNCMTSFESVSSRIIIGGAVQSPSSPRSSAASVHSRLRTWHFRARLKSLRSSHLLSSLPAPTATNFVMLPLLKDRGVFSGLQGMDVDQWLHLYEHISACYRWGPTLMLANAIFPLSETPGVWFDNHEHDITSWDSFKKRFGVLHIVCLGRRQ